MIRLLHTLCLLATSISTLLLTGSARAQSLQSSVELERVKMMHDAELHRIEKERTAKLAALTDKYTAALDRMKVQHQKDGDTAALLALASELKRIVAGDDEEPVASAGTPTDGLKKARRTYEKQKRRFRDEADKAVIAQFENSRRAYAMLSRKFASGSDLDAALAADEAAKALDEDSLLAAASRRHSDYAASSKRKSGVGSGTYLESRGLVAHFPFDSSMNDRLGSGLKVVFDGSGSRSYQEGRVGRGLMVHNSRDSNGNSRKSTAIFKLPNGGKPPYSIAFCFEANGAAHRDYYLLSIGEDGKLPRMAVQYQRKGEDTGSLGYDVPDSDHDLSGYGTDARPDPEWKHVVIAVGKDSIDYYLNGNLLRAINAKKVEIDTSGMDAFFAMAHYRGYDSDGNRIIRRYYGITAVLDDLALYNRKLQPHDVRAMAERYGLLDKKDS